MVYFEWQVDPFLEERLFSPFFSHFSPLRVPKLSTEFWMRTDCATLSLCRECLLSAHLSSMHSSLSFTANFLCMAFFKFFPPQNLGVVTQYVMIKVGISQIECHPKLLPPSFQNKPPYVGIRYISIASQHHAFSSRSQRPAASRPPPVNKTSNLPRAFHTPL